MSYSILEFFDSLEDKRRSQGMRHKFGDLMIIVIMAILSGHQGIRGFTRFAKANDKELTQVLGLKHGAPGYNTFNTLIGSLEKQLYAKKFMEWVKKSFSDTRDEFIALDGKAIRATASEGCTELQNFVSVVSAFGHQSGLVYGMKSFEQNKANEAEALRELLVELGFANKVFTVDALHTQKKRLT